MTTNLRLAGAPGNVLLAAGEAGLPQRSVVNVSQILTIDTSDLTDATCIGALSQVRVRAIPAASDAPQPKISSASVRIILIDSFLVPRIMPV